VNEDPNLEFLEEPTVIPIDGTLDLHTFSPRELPELLDDYLEACREKGIFEVRIIHGKGKGILMKRVHALLSKHPLTESYCAATRDRNNWGATIVTLKRGGVSCT
jgi:DNA-nicking Smr family endonuclease